MVHRRVLLMLSALLRLSSPSATLGQVAAFRGSTEHGLLEARARVRRGERQLHRRRFAEAVALLEEGCAGLEDSFDRLSGLAEIADARVLIMQAWLGAGNRMEALRTAESLAALAQAPPDGRDTPRVRALMEDAQRRVRQGPHGAVRVTSVVKGQAIELDGLARGVTPEDFELPVGRHFIWVQTPLGPIPYRVDLHEGESIRVGQGEPEEVVDEAPEEAGTIHAARRPVLPHRR
jgi:hypothetical protein